MNASFTKQGRLFLLSAVVLSLAPVPASAQRVFQEGAWAKVGATASVDEASVRNVLLNSAGSISLRPELVSAAAVVRFNVHPSPNLHDYRGPDDDFGLDTTFYALVRDNGSASRVVLTLYEMDDATGALSTVARIDSNSPEHGAPPSTDYVRLEVPARPLAFRTKSYFIEGTLTKTASSGNPGIKLVKIQHFP